MSLVSTLSAALPDPVRSPAPRRSEGRREFDAFMHALTELEPPPVDGVHDESMTVTRTPWDGPTRDIVRRAHH